MEIKKINIAIDFGTTNTLVATFEDIPTVMSLPSISRKVSDIDLIPSAIGYYSEKGKEQRCIGVETEKLSEKHIIRRMKRLATSSRYRKILGKDITYNKATKDFLDYLINAIRYRFSQSEIGNIVFTVPVDSFDTYRAIIDEICEKARISKYHVLDESTAAALGYEIALSNEKPYMIIDFGGGTIDASIVKLTRREKGFAVRVLGKSGTNFGGSDIDDWLLEDFIGKNGMTQNLSKYFSMESLKKNIEELKIEIGASDQGEISYYDMEGDFNLKGVYSSAQLSEVLNRNGFSAIIQNCLDNAIDLAYENGVKKRDIAEVLLVGGSSQLSQFQEIIETNFPGRVQACDPFGAIVRGAANFLNDKVVEDFLHHRYALQYLDTKRNLFAYETIIPEGTQFPAVNAKRLIVALPYSGQKRANLSIFEIAEARISDSKPDRIYYDENDNLMIDRSSDSVIIRKVALNPNYQDFIEIDPPSIKGENRLEILFSVDEGRMLRVNVFDLRCNRMLVNNKMIARLS